MRIPGAIAIVGVALLCGCAGHQAATAPKQQKLDPRITRIVRQSVAETLNAVSLPAMKQEPVTWSLSMAEALANEVLDMRLIGKDRLLVIYDSRPPILVAADKGTLLWDGEDDFGRTPIQTSLAGDFAFQAATSGMLALEARREKSFELLGIELATGKVRWRTELPREAGLLVHSLPDDDIFVLHLQKKNRAELRAVRASSGETLWQNEYRSAGGPAGPRSVMTMDKTLLVDRDGLECLSAATSQTVWKRADLRLGKESPQVQAQDGKMYLVDRSNQYVVLDAATGGDLAKASLGRNTRWTNIFLAGDRAYLRGSDESAKADSRYCVVAMDGGRQVWAFQDAEPSVSNILEDGKSLYLATYDSLVALDRSTGTRRFKERIDTLGKGFPVRLEPSKDGIVFIGELAITACNRKTGRPVYRHGFTPISQLAHLDALDEYIARTKDAMKWFTGVEAVQNQDFKSGARDSVNAVARHQDLSNQYYNKAMYESRQPGNSRSYRDFKVSKNMFASTLELQAAQFEREMGMAFEIADRLQAASREITKESRLQLAKLLRVRRAILASYATKQPSGYAHRTVSDAGACGVAVVNLETGKRTDTQLSPSFQEVGLYKLLNVENRTLYHHALRMLPEREQKIEDTSRGMRRYVVCLVAQPIALD